MELALDEALELLATEEGPDFLVPVKLDLEVEGLGCPPRELVLLRGDTPGQKMRKKFNDIGPC